MKKFQIQSFNFLTQKWIVESEQETPAFVEKWMKTEANELISYRICEVELVTFFSSPWKR
jgi:hypothetical protein